MKQLFFLLISLLSSTWLFSQEQNFCELLDTALANYCSLVDSQGKCVLVKCNMYYNEKTYSIEQNHKVLVSLESKIIWRWSKFNLHKGDIMLEQPRLFIQGDTLHVICAGSRCRKKRYFYYGTSVYSQFVYSETDNRWHYTRSFIPWLEYRLMDFQNDVYTKCVSSALDSLSQSKPGETFRVWIANAWYSPELKWELLEIPSNIKMSRPGRFLDYYIGYPEIAFIGKRVRVSVRIIKANKFDVKKLEKGGVVYSKYFDMYNSPTFAD